MVRFHGDGAEALENATLLKVPFPASSAEQFSAQRAFVECVEVGPFWWEDKKQNTLPPWTGSQPQQIHQDSHLSVTVSLVNSSINQQCVSPRKHSVALNDA